MVDAEDYGQFETAWCPGCGDFGILKSVKKALADADLEPHQVIFVSGIGQAAKSPHYHYCNLFNGLHGRSLAAATGISVAKPDMPLLVQSGDGCNYGEGGNHFLAAVRRNINVTLLVHDNQVYGLTKGQASPTSQTGFKTKAQPDGVQAEPFNPIATSIAMKASFVARSFSGMQDHLAEMIVKGIQHEGFSLIDIMQPCISFNKVNNFKWYKDRCTPVPDDHDPTDWKSAMELAYAFPDKIYTGVIYTNDRPAFSAAGADEESRPAALKKAMQTFM
jgi:2-oxoglutarate ferredoxin oxidoreductase subunit beta